MDLQKKRLFGAFYYGPFANDSALAAWMADEFVRSSDHMAWTVFQTETQKQVGTVGLLNIHPEHGRVEIGHVWFTPTVHKTKVNTETQYLLLRYLFDELKYRRVEWKCDARNHASRTTAARMGFIFEGRFRQHMVLRGKNRDTDWFAMTDKEWPRCKVNFETWLSPNNTLSLAELNSG